MTLYTFDKDGPGASNCSGDCAGLWPPLLLGPSVQLTAGQGITGTLGSTLRADGGQQVTYKEKPLYYYSKDQKPGAATGQGVGDVWHVAVP